MTIFIAFITLIIFQRLIELIIAKRNELWMRKQGAIEFRQKHLKWFAYLQFAFFVSLAIELVYNKFQFPNLNIVLLILFMAIQMVRIWCIHILGRFWNKKMIILPKVVILRKGPYKYMKDPNDYIVSLEFIIIPLLFGMYVTAIVFPICYIILVSLRITNGENPLLEKM